MRDGWAEGARAFAARQRGWLVAGAIALLSLLFGRNWLSERLVPDPRLNRQLELAQLALRQGRLSEPGGTGARERFEAVLAADPDQMQARQGLVDVREAAIADAQRAIARGESRRARDQLALAEALAAPEVQLQPLRDRLGGRDARAGDVDRLLAAATAPGVDEGVALARLQQALRLAPANEAALAAREDLLARWLRRADAALAAGKLDEAQHVVTAVVAADPGHLDLPAVQGRLGEALNRRDAARGAALAAAGADERAGRADAAARRYLALQAANATDAEARAGLARLAARMATQAQREAADFRFAAADASLARARRWDPQSDALHVAMERVQQSRNARQRLRHPVGAAERRRLDAALAQARDAIARGEFLSPPGTSAWDRLRVASAIAPGDRAVQAAQRQFATAGRACFASTLAANQLRRAQECLEASLAVDPQRASAGADRAQLAERWAARAEERIGASDWTAAEAALDSARRWTPASATLDALGARLKRARLASP